MLLQRRRNGTLEFDRPETEVVFEGDTIVTLRSAHHTRSSSLIENVMIAANGAVSRFVAAHGFSGIQRVLRKSESWSELVVLARAHGQTLVPEPNAPALRALLAALHASLPLEEYRDACLAVIKLLGRGEYVASPVGADAVGHFALAVTEYSHSTAPNRRYPDVIVHRVLKAALAGAPAPYTDVELVQLAEHCTEREGVASKLERRLRKAAACILLLGKEGASAPAVITGATDKGVWARFELEGVPTEGRVLHAQGPYRVGAHVVVRLERVDVEEGFIDVTDVTEHAGREGAVGEGEGDQAQAPHGRGSASPAHHEGRSSRVEGHAHSQSHGHSHGPEEHGHSHSPQSGEGHGPHGDHSHAHAHQEHRHHE